ncbi:Hypp6206 [Branchiostoma lanceolatum]|uniref:Hypp6206 protein n=1 Tax=Branchiostoma lanceolatum TaxID=7740 RepID=A0A8J9YNS2_BRALA|nr:Hypp6206 [Branchiostoma lanceolatum]
MECRTNGIETPLKGHKGNCPWQHCVSDACEQLSIHRRQHILGEHATTNDITACDVIGIANIRRNSGPTASTAKKVAQKQQSRGVNADVMRAIVNKSRDTPTATSRVLALFSPPGAPQTSGPSLRSTPRAEGPRKKRTRALKFSTDKEEQQEAAPLGSTIQEIRRFIQEIQQAIAQQGATTSRPAVSAPYTSRNSKRRNAAVELSLFEAFLCLRNLEGGWMLKKASGSLVFAPASKDGYHGLWFKQNWRENRITVAAD